MIDSRPPWTLYDYMSSRNLFKEWTLGLETFQIASLNAKLDQLALQGPDGLLSDACPLVKGHRYIHKLKLTVKKVQLRPLFCKGPGDMTSEITLLFGAFERNWKLDPWDAREQAEKRRKWIVEGRAGRCLHERVDGKP